MKENITYGECLSDILWALGLKSSKLAREINIDSSLVYKWLRNERVPSYESPYLDLIMSCIAKRINNYPQKKALIDVLNKYNVSVLETNNDQVLHQVKLVLENSQGYSIQLHNKVKSQHKLYQKRISNVVGFLENMDEKSQISTSSFCILENSSLQKKETIRKEAPIPDRDNVQIVTGAAEILYSLIYLLKKAPRSPERNDSILLTFHSDLILTDISELNRYLIDALYNLLADNWDIILLLKLNTDSSRTIKIIEGIQTLLSVGNLKIYFHRHCGDSFHENDLYIIPKTGVLLTFPSSEGRNDKAFIFHAKQSIEMWTSHYYQELTSASPLLKSYPSQNSVELQRAFVESEEILGNKYVFKNGLSTITMPLDLYEKYLVLSGVSGQELEYRSFLHKRRLDAFETQIKYFKFKDICFIESLEDLVHKKEYAADENYILKNGKPDESDIIRHLESLIDLLEKYDNYEIAFIQHNQAKHIKNINWMVKSNDNVLLETFKKCHADSFQTEMNFTITEKSVVDAFHDYFLIFWNNIPIDNKNKIKTIALIRELINQSKR